MCEVTPENDERQHIHGEQCWCLPEWDEGSTVLIHNAMDCRETCEEATGESVDAASAWRLIRFL